jgi:hypothetical protein
MSCLSTVFGRTLNVSPSRELEGSLSTGGWLTACQRNQISISVDIDSRELSISLCPSRQSSDRLSYLTALGLRLSHLGPCLTSRRDLHSIHRKCCLSCGFNQRRADNNSRNCIDSSVSTGANSLLCSDWGPYSDWPQSVKWKCYGKERRAAGGGGGSSYWKDKTCSVSPYSSDRLWPSSNSGVPSFGLEQPGCEGYH